MALEDVPLDLINDLGQIALWLQGLGVDILIWFIVQAVFIYLNRKRMKEVYVIRDDMKRIERKIDKILTKIK